ncbi:unnamed protein product [Camellia sinensis]
MKLSTSKMSGENSKKAEKRIRKEREAIIATTMDDLQDVIGSIVAWPSQFSFFGLNIRIIDLRFVVMLFGCLKSYFRN